MACFRCEQRTLAALVRTARVCAEVPGFETRIDLRGSCKASLVPLVRKLELDAAAAAKATRGALARASWPGPAGLCVASVTPRTARAART